jgi:hypothetical protein
MTTIAVEASPIGLRRDAFDQRHRPDPGQEAHGWPCLEARRREGAGDLEIEVVSQGTALGDRAVEPFNPVHCGSSTADSMVPAGPARCWSAFEPRIFEP